MKKLIQLYTLVLFFGTASAQVCNDIPNNTTNPDNPQDYRGSNPTTNYYINKDINNPNEPKLDWREVPYSYHINGTTLCPDVYNPFFADDNNENISHLYDQNPLLRDNHPADGWELLSFDLGINYDGSVSSRTHPCMVLYNKHTGVMRVFFFIAPNAFNEDYTNAKIRVEFNRQDANQFESANLNHMEEVPKPIDLYNKKQNESVPNTINGGLGSNNGIVDCHKGQWMQADFVMAYDPCVCQYSYKRFKIQLNLAKNAVINLTGDLTTNVISNPSNAGTGSANWQSQYKTGYKNVADVTKEAKTYYKNTTETVKFVSTLVPKLSEKAKKIPALLELGKGIPYLGTAIGVFNYFVFKEAEANKPKSPPISYNSTVNISGNITDSIWLTPIDLEVPGSVHSGSSNVIGDIPMYDEPLGVVSLLNTPHIEYSHIKAATIDANGNFNPLPPMEPYPTVTEYKIVDPLELVVNPSSELVLTEAKASLVLTYNNTNQKAFENELNLTQFRNYPYIPGVGLGAQMGYNWSNPASPHVLWTTGYSDWEWKKTENGKANLELIDKDKFYKISYGQAPIGCFNNTSFYLISKDEPNQATLPKVVVRLNITMQHPTTKTYYKFVQSYEVINDHLVPVEREMQYYGVEIEQVQPIDEYSTEGWAYINLLPIIGTSPTNNYFADSKNKLDFLFFENETIGGFVDAWDGIILGDNVTIQNGTWITAGRYIRAESENKFNPEVKMQIGIRDQTCLDDPNNFVVTDATALTTWCQYSSAGTYNPLSTKRDFNADNIEDKTERTYSFNLYPNPTDDAINVEVELRENATYNIEVLDLSGRSVFSRVATSQEFNAATITINTSSFNSGIYFVNVTEGENRMTKRLIIAR